MGAGKTTVGELLARRAGREFVDNDAQLAAVTGRTARDVQADEGTEALHELEREGLATALESHTPSVIAAAASVIDDPDSRRLLDDTATVIWLTADVDELAKRAREQPHRPLASDALAQLRQQASARNPLFAEVADLVVDASRPPSDIVDDVLPKLRDR
jgi:shikimate kinase